MTDEDAIDNYLVWELCKREGIRRIIVEDSPEDEELKQFIEKVRNEYREKDYSLQEKKNLLKELDNNPNYRSKIFEEHSWTKETVAVENLGTTMPYAGDLPPEVITGSLPEVIEFVRKANPEKYRSVKYIRNLKEVPKVLNEFLPWVVTPGNIIRKPDKMNREHGENNWDVEDTWGAINDGNHRTIAKILANDLEEIECYIGQPNP